jgi:N-acetylmuramoyl-L-alanine amidase
MRYKITYLLILLVLSLPLAGKANPVIHLNLSEKNNLTRITVSSDTNLDFKVFTLSDPERVVMDVLTSTHGLSIPAVTENAFIKSIRSHTDNNGSTRFVFDTSTKAFDVQTQKILPENNGQHQFVLDILHPPASFEDMVKMAIKTPPVPSHNPTYLTNKASQELIPIPVPRPKIPVKPVIMIDAGHGGYDPGSIGRRGTKEKDITLRYAIALYDILKKTEKFEPILTRKNDRFIALNERVELARNQKADLFISLHADSHDNPHVRGMSVYTLSDTASDKEAAALASKENKADIITGIDLKHEDNSITDVLIAFAQRDSMNQSALFAEHVVESAGDRITLLGNPHRFAGFRVLTAADIPSVLIELGYLSNPREEKLLTTEKHKNELVQIIIAAIYMQFP